MMAGSAPTGTWRLHSPVAVIQRRCTSRRTISGSRPRYSRGCAYALWKCRSGVLDLHAVHPELEGRVELGSPTERAAAARRLAALGEGLDSAEAQQLLLERCLPCWDLTSSRCGASPIGVYDRGGSGESS